MSFVSYVPTSQADPAIQPLFEGMEKKRGVSNFLRVLAHSPGLLQGFLSLDGALGKIKLPGKLRELAYLKASQVNSCAYCSHYHRMFGQKAGLNERQLADLASYETSDAYDDLERDVLRFAEQVTRNVRADEALIKRLRERLSEQELVELTVTVGLANLTNRLNEALRIELP
jgi:uncharacterized peroxidase-related enzyme